MAIPSPVKCSCGAAYPLIGEIRGRSDDVFRYGDSVSVHPLVYRTPLGQHPMIEQYQVHQTAKGAKILIIVRGSVDCIQLTQDIVTEVEKAGLKNPEIEISIVDMLQRHSETGKLKRFVPLKT